MGEGHQARYPIDARIFVRISSQRDDRAAAICAARLRDQGPSSLRGGLQLDGVARTHLVEQAGIPFSRLLYHGQSLGARVVPG